MGPLITAGVLELTVGVLSGWLMVAAGSDRWRTRLRMVDTRRIRQGHLDLLIMGAILVALGAADLGLPVVATVFVIAGSWLAPLLFFPLAWRPSLGDCALMVWLDRAGFVMLTAGYLIAAWIVLS
ncbi:hypothetical protein MMAG44476_14545 [Mycolicibacterium mageritense DSM 44476 = CIP 104973]|uniref:Uncharacterized protein n=1 Tax=Mycolicibacterium mageritense TaxID=53462 RepID=A0ABM7HSZ2_MYCME|nr:hypothetical protein [Mycolicibacterium mageritense]MCC9184973.1 hypothetical protein [Mycolicibacterium mageritense]BBX33682.1 hypothetical protein MMAGJ_29640 [Mycolicibacterium mageritense]CDO22109.1 hypothetical protein BN978_02574 [Mycolicibacterium mageritense DSM 44476 = CIP 104973]